MQKTTHVYHNLGYGFLFLLIVLVPIGFYKTYFSVLLQPHPSIMHIHFTFMSLWILTLITQPFLIKYKKFNTHRLIGKISYVLVPCLLIAAWFMIRYSYYHFIDQAKANTQNHFTGDQILQQAASYEAIAFVYISWLALFYSLAIINRRQTTIHSRFMLAAGLTMIGPAVDRIFGYAFGMEKFPGNIPIECFSFLVVDIILVTLLLRDYKNKKPVRILWACLVIYLVGEILELYLTNQNVQVWKNIVTFLMKPVP